MFQEGLNNPHLREELLSGLSPEDRADVERAERHAGLVLVGTASLFVPGPEDVVIGGILLTKTGHAVARVGDDVISAMARGRQSEARVLDDVGLGSNSQRVSTSEGYSVPDALTDTLSVEIKDTQSVSATQQIRIQTDAVAESGRQSVLVTGTNTRVSRQAQERFDVIIRRDDLGPQN